MKKGLMVLLFVLISMTTHATEVNDFFGQFLNKSIDVEYSNNSGKSANWAINGILESVSEYGIIVKTKDRIIFINYDCLVTIKMKK